MRFRGTHVFVATLVLGASLAVANGVLARTQPGLIGQPSVANTANCFIWSSNPSLPGLIHNCGGTGSWMIPLIWDSSGPKTVRISARQTAASQVMCAADTFSASGVHQGTVFFPAFASSGYSTRQITIPSVPAGGTSAIQCTMTTSNARLLVVDYF